MGDDGPTSTPDWTRPFGVTTPRVDTPIPKQASWPEDHNPVIPIVNEDRTQRNESDGDALIWAAYEAGY